MRRVHHEKNEGKCEEKTDEVCPVCHVDFSKVVAATSAWKDKRLAVIVASAVMFSLGFFLQSVSGSGMLSELLLLGAAAVPGVKIVKEGISALIFQRNLNIDFLITVAVIGSFAIGHGEEGAAVVFLFYSAEFLEDHSVDKVKNSLGGLIKLAPEVAMVKRKGKEVRVHSHSVDVSEVIVLRPGDKIPLDGVVVTGVSGVNQAAITGESVPVTKQVGDEVYAGTVNCEGFIEVKVTKRSTETMLSKIVKLVEDAQKNKSPTEKFIDKFSKYYTPAVILLAATVALVPSFMFGLSFDEWFYKALILLVVSCPCALAISTPVTMISGMTSAARNGVLIKGSNYLEEISKVGIFAFDKTGTLTEGKLEVTDVIPLGHHSPAISASEVLARAASLEALSEHPIAKAIVRKAENEGVRLESVSNFRAFPGKGVAGQFDGGVYHVGNERMFQELSICFPKKQVEKLQNEGKTVVLVGDGGRTIGLVAVMDKIRDSAVEVVSELKKRGIRTEMITGDNERAAKAIARKLGIDEYHDGLLPEGKVNVIESHSKQNGGIAVVGDGVNDAPALVRANVGIAMGAIGSDAALETANIALMKDDLSKIPYLIRLSKKARGLVKKNIVASILVKGALAVLVFPGLVTLWLAVAVGDMGLSLAVILNAMRLSLLKPRGKVGQRKM